MVHMRMRQKHIVNLCLIHRHLTALKGIGALLHTAVHKHVFAARLQEMTAPRHLMICSHKGKFHTNSSFIHKFSVLDLYLFYHIYTILTNLIQKIMIKITNYFILFLQEYVMIIE